MHRGLSVLAVLALAACGGQEPEPAARPEAEPAPAESSLIPTEFQGVWDESPEACAQPSSLRRITIAGDELTFWESSGTATSVERTSGNAAIITAAMEGEGQTYEGRFHFTASPDGATLTETQTVLEIGTDGVIAPPAVTVLHRCPA